MKVLPNAFSRWLAIALSGALAGYVYAVLEVEPVAHSSALSAWPWFGRSYGSFIFQGLLLGAVVGALVLWQRRRRAELSR